MAPRFGTDGIRGAAGSELTPDLVRALGRAAVAALGTDVPFLIARDPRESGPELEAAITDGIARAGGTVRLLGMLPTPGLAASCAATGAAGVMISASHNVFSDNGVKLFEPGGRKLRDETEAAVEAALAADDRPEAESAGSITTVPNAADAYVAHLVMAAGGGSPFTGLSVVVDAANGAASEVGPRALRELGATVEVLHAEPNGTNINAGCGSTYPDVVAEAVRAMEADCGLAFDGDADRIVAVDASGAIVDGDHILAILAIDLQARDRLRNDAIATTVMANLGLVRALEPRGIDVIVTPVGDRHVLAAMEDHDLVLGGEQSGHIIESEYAVTGDGPLTGILVLAAMVRSGRSLAELASVVVKYPQVLRNVRVANRDGLDAATEFWAAVAGVEADLAGEGRVLVRPSGTEPVVRVMVEAASTDAAERFADALVDALTGALGAG
ncbi:MAG: phosphoglucosamine mutase [Acidimicrobiia bacterium]|nr:phosphoglucosamine mutase [Acidimicrobiia bacterium]